MAKEKSSFVLHYSKALQIANEELTDTEVGQLFRAIVSYEIDGQVTHFDDRTLNMLIKGVYFDLDQNRQKYANTCKRNKEIAEKRHSKDKRINAKESGTETSYGVSSLSETLSAAIPHATIEKQGMSEDEIAQIKATTMPDSMRDKLKRLKGTA